MIKTTLGWLVLAASLALAQTVHLVPKYKPGQRYALEIRKSRESGRPSQMTGSNVTKADLEVLSSTQPGYRLRAVFGETVITGPNVAANPLLRAAAQATKGIEYEIGLNAGGEYQALLNQDQVVANLLKVREMMVEQLGASLPPDRRTQLRAMMEKVMSPQVMAASATKELQLLFALAGAELKAGEALSLPMLIPNPLGGSEKLSSTLELKLRQFDAAAKLAYVDWKQTYDAAAISTIAGQLVRQAAPGTPIPPNLKGELVDDAKYTYDLDAGMVQHVRHVRTVTADANLRRVDTTEVTAKRVE